MISNYFWQKIEHIFSNPLRILTVLFFILSTLALSPGQVNADETTPPLLTVTGATADGSPMEGSLGTGYILNIRGSAATADEHLIQFADGTNANEPLEDTYFGLTLTNSTVSAQDLENYYIARGIPDPWLTHLVNAANRSEPFVYIKGSTVRLVDAAKYEHSAVDVDMTVPDDFPLGTYTVSGSIRDLYGNPTTVTLILIVQLDPINISGNTGTPDVTLTYNDGGTQTVISNGGGHYSITVPLNWSGTITPSKDHYTFTPVNRSYDPMTADSIDQDYTATFFNSAPVISDTKPASVTMSEDGMPGAFDLTLHASDADGDTLTWNVSSAASNGTASASGSGPVKAIGYTPNANYFGTDSFVIQVSDGFTGTDTIIVNVTINSVNDPPVVTDIPNQTIDEGASFTTITLDNYVSDVEDLDSALAWSFTGESALTVSITDRVATITTPGAEWSGSETITFRATDTGAAYDDDAATFTVSTVNDAPVVTGIPDQTIAEGASFATISLDNYVSDVDNTKAELIWTFSGNTALSVSILDRVATISTPGPDWNGQETIAFKATDPGGKFSEDSAIFTVTSENDPPVVTDIPNQTIAEGATFTTINLDDYVSDADNTDPQISWTYSGNTALSVSIVDRVATITTPDLNWNGAETITFKATDPTALFDDDPATFTVTPVNDVPTNITLTPSSVAENLPVDTVVGGFSTTDADTGDTFTYQLAAGTGDTDNASFIIDGSNLKTQAIFDKELKSSYSIRVKTTDSALATFEKTFTITITDVNDPPVISEGITTNVTMSEDGTPTPFSLTLHATDQDLPANTLTWSVSTAALHGVAAATGTGSSKAITYNPYTNYNGSDSFVVQVSDGVGGTATITINVTVEPDDGDIYYVDNTNPAASDLNAGTTPSFPFLTILKGADKARAGDTVMVLAGTYAETVIPDYNGVDGHPVTFTAASQAVTVTGEAGNTTNGGGFRLTGWSYITINGFTIANTDDYGIYSYGTNHLVITNNRVTSAGTIAEGLHREGIWLHSTTDSLISGNISDHNSSNGIRLITGSNNNTVSENISYGNATETESRATGIECWASSNNTIIHNIAYGNEDTGLNFYSGSVGNMVIGNLSYGNGDHGIDHNNAPSNIITGNTVYGNVTSGINLENGSTGATLANNISVDNGLLRQVGGGVVASAQPGNIRVDTSSTSGTIMDYDMVFHTTGTGLVQFIWGDSNSYTTLSAFRAARPSQEVHGLESNPLFTTLPLIAERPALAPYNVAINIGDFHILSGSPAIDRANSNALNEPELDIEGMARYDDPLTTNNGAGVRTYDDRGAYEFQPTATYLLSISKAGTGTGTVTSSPAGINCGADCSEIYSYGTSVILTATPTVGYYNRFTGWSGTGISCPGTGTCTVTINAAKTVTANFEKTTFSDVPFTHPRWAHIEALYDAGLTAGCQASGQPLAFCPENTMIRVESAVFMVRGQLGAIPTPTDAEPYVFTDDFSGVSPWGQPWAEKMWDLGMTAGCQYPADSPNKLFCPYSRFSREMGAVFALRISHGASMPVPVGTGKVFADMTDPNYWGTGWAELAYAEGLLPECGIDSVSGKPLFCPSDELSRSWSAYTIVLAKDIPLPQ